jgi:hypothetical protein
MGEKSRMTIWRSSHDFIAEITENESLSFMELSLP